MCLSLFLFVCVLDFFMIVDVYVFYQPCIIFGHMLHVAALLQVMSAACRPLRPAAEFHLCVVLLFLSLMVPSPVTFSRRLQRKRAAEKRRRHSCVAGTLPVSLVDRIAVIYEQAVARQGLHLPPGLVETSFANVGAGSSCCDIRVSNVDPIQTSVTYQSVDAVSDCGFTDVASDAWEEARFFAQDAVRSLHIFPVDTPAAVPSSASAHFVSLDTLDVVLSALKSDVLNEITSSCIGLDSAVALLDFRVSALEERRQIGVAPSSAAAMGDMRAHLTNGARLAYHPVARGSDVEALESRLGEVESRTRDVESELAVELDSTRATIVAEADAARHAVSLATDRVQVIEEEVSEMVLASLTGYDHNQCTLS